MIRTDIAIIGAGPAGYTAALRARQLGAEVVCIERDEIGGVCLNWGCIPTKALLRSAEIYELMQEASRFGVLVQETGFDWAQIQARKQEVVDQMVRGITLLMDRAGVEMVQGTATLAQEDIISVALEGGGEERIVADHIVIATGSRTLQVPIPGLDDPNVLNSRAVLAMEELPDSLCVIGGGAIGLEFASLYNTFGMEVTLVEMLPRVAPLMDRSVGEGLEWSLGQAGIDVRTNTRVTRIEHGDGGCTVHVEGPDGEAQIEAEKVLSAIGRAPNIENLGLENLGLKPSRAGIQVDEHMRTAIPHIYAIGDVASEGAMLAHVGSHQGIVAVENAMGHTAVMDYTAVPSCIFSLPEAASVGLTQAQAEELGYDVQVGTFALANNGKAVANGDTDGFVKIISEAEYDAVLGVHIVGPHASDLILEGTLAINLESTLTEIDRTIHPHPALGEAIAEAALAARQRALMLPASR